MRKPLKIIISIFALLVILPFCCIIGYLGYLGFVPGVSNLLGSNKPVDLGVVYTEEDFKTYNDKANATVVPFSEENVDPADSLRYSEPIELTVEMTQEEVSARIGYSQWRYLPVSDIQIRFNPDGTVEGSGKLITQNAIPFLTAVGYASEEVGLDKVAEYLTKIPVNPPIYVKGSAIVYDNDASVSFESLQVGRYNIAPDRYGGSSTLTSFANKIISRINGLYIKRMEFVDGKVIFDGNVPSYIEEQTK